VDFSLACIILTTIAAGLVAPLSTPFFTIRRAT
jgi:hypothetical protein